MPCFCVSQKVTLLDSLQKKLLVVISNQVPYSLLLLKTSWRLVFHEVVEALNLKFCGALYFKVEISWFSETRNDPKSSVLMPSHMRDIPYQHSFKTSRLVEQKCEGDPP